MGGWLRCPGWRWALFWRSWPLSSGRKARGFAGAGRRRARGARDFGRGGKRSFTAWRRLPSPAKKMLLSIRRKTLLCASAAAGAPTAVRAVLAQGRGRLRPAPSPGRSFVPGYSGNDWKPAGGLLSPLCSNDSKSPSIISVTHSLPSRSHIPSGCGSRVSSGQDPALPSRGVFRPARGWEKRR